MPHTPVVPTSKWAICPELHADADAVLFDSEEEAKAWPQSTGARGWLEHPLPVISRVGCAGPPFSGLRLGEWQGPEDIAPMPDGGTTVAELVESALLELRGQTAWPTCYLDDDWGFAALEAEAYRGEGHGYVDRRASSAPAVVFKAVCDFDGLIRSPSRAAPLSAVVRFWQSWQVHRHVARLCRELSTSRISRTLPADPRDWDAAEWTVRRLMNAYARAMEPKPEEAAPAQPASPPKSDGKGQKRGPKPVEGAAELAEIVTRMAPDGDWRSKLDNVCEALDEAQIPFPRRWRKRDRSCKGWVDYDERANAVKAIDYRLKTARQRKIALPETLS